MGATVERVDGEALLFDELGVELGRPGAKHVGRERAESVSANARDSCFLEQALYTAPDRPRCREIR